MAAPLIFAYLSLLRPPWRFAGKGGKARAVAINKRKRAEIARKAAKARWHK